MKANEVLRRYATGERDFRRLNLRGRSFKGKDLSGADFSYADIRGANFTNTRLIGADFKHAETGLKRYFALSVIVISLLLSVVLGFISAFVGSFAAFLFLPTTIAEYNIWLAVTFLTILLSFCVFIVRQSLGMALRTTTVALVATGFVAGLLTLAEKSVAILALAGFGALALALTLAITLAIAGAIARIAVDLALTVVGIGVIALAVAVVGAIALTKVEVIFVAIFVASILILLSGYLSGRSLAGDTKFVWIREIAVNLVAIGGTSFRGADLTDADFTQAVLKNTDFRTANLTRTCFYQARKLHFARVGSSILAAPEVQALLVTGDGSNKSYIGANLKGAYLAEADLRSAYLKEADISQAEFYGADLRGANLVKVRALGTNFTGASLTGACLEAWKIDKNTNLDQVDCSFFYLLEENRERRPFSGEFLPGEFTKLLQEVVITSDLIFRNGVDWKAFVLSFNAVQAQNEGADLSLQSIENKGDGVIVAQLNVSQDADKEKIHSEFMQSYELALKVVEERYKAKLNAKDEQIEIYRQQSSKMQEIVSLLANRPINVDIKSQIDSSFIAVDVSTKAESDINITLVIKFLEQAGATVNREDTHRLVITDILGSLYSYKPLPILFVTAQPSEHDVTELLENSKKLPVNPQKQAGILIYLELPDPIFRMRMTEVRLRDHFTVIPIPFAAIEKALLDSASPKGLLAQYADRYLPGADLFNDSNAIGDTITFFGRVDLLHRLEEELSRNQAIGLFGLRKSGKTSLLLQLGFAMRQHPVVHIDLQTYGGRRYGAKLFKQIIKHLSKIITGGNYSIDSSFEPFEDDRPAAELTTVFAERIHELAKTLDESGYQLPILCFLDEIERILPTAEDSRERAEEFNAFFGVLRALSQEQRYLSILVADVHPDCNRINQWSQAGVSTNPVFHFFKEQFLSPFSKEETTRMINDIGKIMGLEFDEETTSTIHIESGGYPFTARQLASLLYNKLATEGNKEIHWSAAQRYLKKPLLYSGLLKSYVEENIWNDLKKRNFFSAMATLKIFACNESSGNRITEQVLQKRLKDDNFTEDESQDALRWLVDVGLVSREEAEDENYYYLRAPLLSRWLRMYMKQEEMQQWQVH